MAQHDTPAPDGTRTLHLISLGELLVEFTRRDDGRWCTGFAGDAFNALFYAGRLGLRTGFISALGEDLFTPMLREGIASEGIDSSHLLHLKDRRNGLYFIELDERGEYTFHFWRAGSAATQTLRGHDPAELAEYVARSQFLLITGVTLAVMEGEELLPELLEKLHGRARVALDTNYRPRLWSGAEEYRRRLERVLPMADIFLPTASDLLAAFPGEALEDVLPRLAGMGPAITVVKDGSHGCAVAGSDGLRWFPPKEEVDVVDATGAGDAFNAGFLAGLARGLGIEESVELGQRVARHVLRVRGALDMGFRGEMITAPGVEGSGSRGWPG